MNNKMYYAAGITLLVGPATAMKQYLDSWVQPQIKVTTRMSAIFGQPGYMNESVPEVPEPMNYKPLPIVTFDWIPLEELTDELWMDVVKESRSGDQFHHMVAQTIPLIAEHTIAGLLSSLRDKATQGTTKEQEKTGVAVLKHIFPGQKLLIKMGKYLKKAFKDGHGTLKLLAAYVAKTIEKYPTKVLMKVAGPAVLGLFPKAEPLRDLLITAIMTLVLNELRKSAFEEIFGVGMKKGFQQLFEAIWKAVPNAIKEPFDSFKEGVLFALSESNDEFREFLSACNRCLPGLSTRNRCFEKMRSSMCGSRPKSNRPFDRADIESKKKRVEDQRRDRGHLSRRLCQAEATAVSKGPELTFDM